MIQQVMSLHLLWLLGVLLSIAGIAAAFSQRRRISLGI